MSTFAVTFIFISFGRLYFYFSLIIDKLTKPITSTSVSRGNCFADRLIYKAVSKVSSPQSGMQENFCSSSTSHFSVPRNIDVGGQSRFSKVRIFLITFNILEMM